jgi:3-dehydroquinate dehydratase
VFTQLCKQAWFVCLMVFAIGWSSVSVASVKTMQISMQMQHEQIQNQTGVDHATMMQHMSVQDMKQHCADLEVQNQQNDGSALSLTDCHNQLIQSQHVQHADCQNCALFSCQSSIVWFNTDIPKLTVPQDNSEQNSPKIHYQAQHLAGHWQEILRPPKA